VAVIFFLDLWAYDLASLWKVWGLIAALIGVIFTPLVASVIAIVASVLHRDWVSLGTIVIYVIITMGAYLGGNAIENRA